MWRKSNNESHSLSTMVAKRSLLKLENANGLYDEDLKRHGGIAHSVGMVDWSISGSGRKGSQIRGQRKHMQPVKQVALAQATSYKQGKRTQRDIHAEQGQAGRHTGDASTHTTGNAQLRISLSTENLETQSAITSWVMLSLRGLNRSSWLARAGHLDHREQKLSLQTS